MSHLKKLFFEDCVQNTHFVDVWNSKYGYFFVVGPQQFSPLNYPLPQSCSHIHTFIYTHIFVCSLTVIRRYQSLRLRDQLLLVDLLNWIKQLKDRYFFNKVLIVFCIIFLFFFINFIKIILEIIKIIVKYVICTQIK